MTRCCICGQDIKGFGHSPAPVKSEGVCCDSCNITRVVPARMKALTGHGSRFEELDEMLDAMDDQIRQRYPEIEHAWLHQTIGAKVQLEIERAQLKAHPNYKGLI